jgi:predicted small secreted protein
MKSFNSRMLWTLVLTLCGALWVLTSLTACNTTEGVGEDIEEAGDAIEDAAD